MRCTTVGSFLLRYFAFFAMLFSAPAAWATPIVPGAVQFPAIAEPDPVGATLVFSTGPLSFSSATLDGTLRSTVWSNDATNPFGPNALTFTYELSASLASIHDIVRLAVSNFDSFQTDASFNPASGVPPTFISRSLDGEVMGFSFIAPALDAGQTASLLVVQTNATAFQSTTAFLINGTTASVSSLAPIAATVPEPSTIALALLGGLILVVRRFRR